MQLDVLRTQWRHSVRFLRTVRHLKLRQVTNRLYRQIKKPVLLVLSDRDGTFNSVTGWSDVVSQPKSILSPESVMFLNEIGLLGSWNDSSKSDLWRYNLHYFNYLHETLEVDSLYLKKSLIASWIEQNQPRCSPAWDPYPASLRIVNWVKWLLAGNEPVPAMLESLFQQTYVLNQQLEYHLQGNHLLANAKALVFAGSFFEGDVAQGWLQKGLELLDEQHCEQILADGAHFELSPMYHSIILMDLLDIIQLGRCYPGYAVSIRSKKFRDTASSMANWLESMLHPDGEIPFFNDAAFGIAPKPHTILEYAKKMDVVWAEAGVSSRHNKSSGYVVMRQRDQTAFLDVAAIGPDYIPGHAHADTLSFEWSLYGVRVLVNSGVSQYEDGDIRRYERGTEAHNTVLVNEKDSSEVWGAFRVARRAKPINVSVNYGIDHMQVSASHTGYHRYRPKITHARNWEFKKGMLEVRDVLSRGFRTAEACFHFHPDVVLEMQDEGLKLILPDERGVVAVTIVGGKFKVESSYWSPEFGKRCKSKRLVISFAGTELVTRFTYGSCDQMETL